MLFSTLAAGPANGPVLGSPRLARGDELVYVGHIEEASERVGNRFRKRHEYEVRVFVLEALGGVADCAVLTKVRPLADPAIAGPAAAITGADPAGPVLPAAVRLDLVRIDARGRAMLLAPAPGPWARVLGPTTPTRVPAPAPIDGPPVIELGAFLPLPARPVTLGGSWATAEPGRPPIVWTAAREAVWNGGQCLEVTASQQSDGWDRPDLAPAGWKRTETLLTAPADGIACAVKRRIERRVGASTIGWVEVAFEARPTRKHDGTRYDDVRRDIETAYALAQELAGLSRGTRPNEFRARLLRIDRFVADHPFRTGFREALETVRRRYEAALRGEAFTPVDPIPEVEHTLPAVGKPAPDFVVPGVSSAEPFRLSAARGQPVVLLFYKPSSKTAAGSLRVAEALHALFAGKARTVALAVANPDGAARQSETLKLTVPVLDGTGLREAYGIDVYPKLFVVGPDGLVAWQFEGHGPETGYLARREVEKLVK